MSSSHINALTNYWTENLALDVSNVDKCKVYAKAVVSKLYSWRKSHRHLKHLLDIKTQLDMLAEVFQENVKGDASRTWQGCKEYIDSSEEDPTIPENINCLNLYDMFIKKKWNDLLPQKNSTNSQHDDEFEECLSCHEILALETIFGKTIYKGFSCYQSAKNIQVNLLKLGITENVNNEFSFIHKSFADYFVARSFIEELQLNQDLEIVKLLIDEVFSKVECKLIRNFFDNCLENITNSIPTNFFRSYQNHTFDIDFSSEYMPCVVHLLAEEGCLATVKLLFKCIKYRRSSTKPAFRIISLLHITGRFLVRQGGLNIEDQVGKTPLHYATQSGQLQMIKFLVENGASIDSKDFFNNTPLYLALLGGYLKVVKYLVKCGANVNHRYCKDNSLTQLAATKDELVTQRYPAERGTHIGDKRYDSEYAIQVAIKRGALNIVRILVEKGASVDVKDSKNNTLLHLALERGHSDIAKFLVESGAKVCFDVFAAGVKPDTVEFLAEQGADVNIGCTRNQSVTEHNKNVLKYGMSLNNLDENGQSLLYNAVKRCQHDKALIEFLLDNGADVNLRGSKCSPILHEAVLNATPEIVELLAKKTKCLDVRNNHGDTPLFFGLLIGRFDNIRPLIENGADVSVKNGCYTPLDFAVMKGNLDIVKFMIKCNPQLHPDTYQTGMFNAIVYEHVEIVKLFISIGFNVNLQIHFGSTALHIAVEENKLEIFKLLLEHGGNVNVRNEAGRTPLHVAARQRRMNFLEFLADQVDFNATDREGRTALHLAIQDNNIGVIEFLVQKIDCDIADNHGCTALHLACAKKDVNVVKFLAQRTSNINLRNKEGRTALHVAAWNQKPNIVIALLESGANVNAVDENGATVLHLTATGDSLECVKFVAERIANVNATDNNGNTVLHAAATNYKSDIGQFIMDIVEDVDAKNNEGRTPLHTVADSSNIPFSVEPLWQRTANINVVDNTGSTPLHLAARRNQENIVTVLVKHGADATLQDGDGNTALHIAALHGQLKNVQCLADRAIANIRNNMGFTAVQLAAYNFHLDVVDFLSIYVDSTEGREDEDLLRYLNPDAILRGDVSVNNSDS